LKTEVILVDADDHVVGTMEKMKAHKEGILHRAFSILIFNKEGEMLLQKRAKSKYHSGGLWTNACCSHPAPDEDIAVAAQRRLMEEMGINASIQFAYKFTYKAVLDNHLIEHEVDHVYTASFEGRPVVNANEVEDWKFMEVSKLLNDVQLNPESYTSWFKIILQHQYGNSFNG
jgi:isopentenyl-diphosphate delta-isomerase